MSPLHFFATFGLLFGTILAIFAMKYGSAAYQARERLAKDGAYQSLAEKAAAAQSDSAATLAAIRGEVSRIAERLDAVEKMLKEVG